MGARRQDRHVLVVEEKPEPLITLTGGFLRVEGPLS